MRAIISGGSRGIGLAVARKFLVINLGRELRFAFLLSLFFSHKQKHDIAVTLVASNEDRLRLASEELSKLPSSPNLVSYKVCNLAIKEEIEKCCGQLLKDGSSDVDILVNAAGVTYNKLLVTAGVEQMKSILDVNLLATMLFTKYIVRQMIRQKRPGAIVTIGTAQLFFITAVLISIFFLYFRQYHRSSRKRWSNGVRRLKGRFRRLHKVTC